MHQMKAVLASRSALPLAGDVDAELVGLLASMVLGVAARG